MREHWPEDTGHEGEGPEQLDLLNTGYPPRTTSSRLPGRTAKAGKSDSVVVSRILGVLFL